MTLIFVHKFTRKLIKEYINPCANSIQQIKEEHEKEGYELLVVY